MMDNLHAMIDIETLDVANTALVLQVAGAYFDDFSGEISEEFTWNLLHSDQVAMGRSISEDTQQWWDTFPSNIKDPVFDQTEAIMPEDFLEFFTSWVSHPNDGGGVTTLWSQGSFDFDILGNMYSTHNTMVPWKYYQLRDSRTYLNPFNKKGVGKLYNTHIAIEDVKNQINKLLHTYKGDR